MITLIRAPKVDVNEDDITVIELHIRENQYVSKGEELVVVETLKTTLPVESDRTGYIRRILVTVGDQIAVGTPLLILADSIDEEIDEEELFAQAGIMTNRSIVESNDTEIKISLKAKILAKELGVNLDNVPPTNGRIRTEDVENFHKQSQNLSADLVSPPYTVRKMNNFELGTLDTLSWATREAASAYLEHTLNFRPLLDYSQQIQHRNDWIFDPLISLLAWFFTRVIVANVGLNTTQRNKSILEYKQVNLGFTVDVQGQLFFPVLHNVGEYDQTSFIAAFVDLQRRTLKRTLVKQELSGATIGFSSLSSFGVTRHQPILPPHTSLMLAHSATLPFSTPETAYTILGATYDHKVHSGSKVAKMLQNLSATISHIPIEN